VMAQLDDQNPPQQRWIDGVGRCDTHGARYQTALSVTNAYHDRQSGLTRP
jgi:hypothetical protein